MLAPVGDQQISPRAQALLAGLNAPQQRAVEHGDGPLLILAGAGSGKTRVLTHRIAYLVETGAARPEDILAITFTNKAAGEMRERVEHLLGRGMRGMWLTTFHSASARILRNEADRLGFTRSFTIYDQADSRRLARRSAEAVGVDLTRFKPAALQAQISDAKNRLIDAKTYREQAGSQFEEMIGEVYLDYEREIRRMNAMDFDDLLMRLVQLLEQEGDVRSRYANAFTHVLVDEYQDTNHAQYRLLQLLMAGREPGAPRNLAVVGDDAQSIYGFRGADVRNILDFERDFPEAEVVKLEQNYRSTETILQVANAVIANNHGGIAKELWSDLGPGDPVQLRELSDEHAEARYIVGEAQRLIDEGTSPAEIAVLYRTNAMSRVIEDQLVRSDVAYQVIGGTKFYERAEIKDAVAYLTLLANPADVVAFTRVVNSPRRGIGNTSLARVTGQAQALEETIWDTAAEPSRVSGLGAAAVKALGRFMATMVELRELAETGTPVAELLQTLLSRSGYTDALQAERTIEAEGRIENLEQLVEVAREFGRERDETGTLDEFLQQIALVADADSRRGDSGLLTLMTLHNAKGLEYPVVFIAGMEDGVFPHSRSIDEGSIEEERRLFYVGVTRAMRTLYMTFARRRAVFGQTNIAMRSRFIDEVPAHLLTTPAPPAFGTSLGAPAGAGAAAGEQFRLGEDVIHASLGDGVVTGLEPGGVIVVRFAGDGSERKLVTEYAPLRRAS
jgi:DNA helicase-2/ATP-dependent DNA helicase PcrA